jgi:K+-sensing histidine kinase KdpD
MVRPHQTALAIVCGEDGKLTEILHDELGLPRLQLGAIFTSLLLPSSRRKATRFLRAAIGSHAALDWDLDVALAQGVVRLYFSAGFTDRAMTIIGTKEPLGVSTFPEGLAEQGYEGVEALAPALRKLRHKREAQSKSSRRLHEKLDLLNSSLQAPAARPPKMRAKKAALKQIQLLEVVAHDLRNPISGILAASQYLIYDAAPVLEEQHLTLLQSIESSTELLLRIIEDLLEIPAIAPRELRKHVQPTDLSWLAGRSAAMNRPLADSKNVRMEIRTVGQVPCLNVDPLKMTLAINALLANAIKCSQPGNMIGVTIVKLPDSVAITIREEGQNTSFNDLKALFEALRHGRSVQGLKETRTAFTLANVRRIIEAHHGTIEVETNVGNVLGLTVTLPLPLHPVSKASHPR